MAEPVLTVTLLTPISVRLAWTYSGGAADFEVFWKSDHPAGQEYVRHGVTSGLTYDVGSLSWTTTYYFKVRAISGATYGNFSNEVNLFVCCGQAVVIGNPGPPTTFLMTDYYQQAAAPGTGFDVTFVAKDVPHTVIYIWDYDGPTDDWSFGATVAYVGNYYPVGVRQQRDNVAIVDTQYGVSSWYRALIFTFYDKLSSNTTWPYPESAYSSGWSFDPPSIIYYLFTDGLSSGYIFVDFDPRSTANCVVFNADKRIVLGLYMEAWPYYSPGSIDSTGWDLHIFQIKVSNDSGVTWTDENIYISQWELSYWSGTANAGSIAEDGDGNIWCLAEDVYLDPDYRVVWGTGLLGNGQEAWNQWDYQDDSICPIMYVVLKWVEGSGATVVREIVSTLVKVYGTGPSFALLEPGYAGKGGNIAAEGDTIAVAYHYSYTMDSPVSNRYYGDAVIKLDISTNGGSSWATKTITGAWKIDPEWRTMMPAICVSDGNIVVYLIGGTYAAQTRHIMRSTDDGDTWSEVYAFAGVDAFDYPWVVSVKSNGPHIVLTGCKFGVTTGGSLAYFESRDAGATWAPVEITPSPEEQILVPA